MGKADVSMGDCVGGSVMKLIRWKTVTCLFAPIATREPLLESERDTSFTDVFEIGMPLPI